ncbi:NADH-ubiquinone oxidoreductase-related-like protein [Hibiscus syriacus]|uniref:NADH-ubiquinone oxidoreductase-related-like protein n=2 Tax=Hibiscus syriacus TaxID=106335 RepID=A0A6A3BG71_HIBSY|nr:NADH-ubiquinone oxidoreductase-related-like protein [Hibiscus syriacus]
MSQKTRQSPYLRNLWPQLQAKPTRTRKRGRAALSSAAPLKRTRTNILEFYSPSFVTSRDKNLSLQGFPYGIPQLSVPNCGTVGGSMDSSSTLPASLITLPLLPCSPSVPLVTNKMTVIDLNTVAKIPEEMDLLNQLQSPPTSSVIAPQPVRLQPVGSIISVGCIKENKSLTQAPKKPEEVEKEVESEAWPAIVSDSNNKVRLANSAYKQMVGQPECPWLDSIVTCEGRVIGNSCKKWGSTTSSL